MIYSLSPANVSQPSLLDRLPPRPRAVTFSLIVTKRAYILEPNENICHLGFNLQKNYLRQFRTVRFSQSLSPMEGRKKNNFEGKYLGIMKCANLHRPRSLPFGNIVVQFDDSRFSRSRPLQQLYATVQTDHFLLFQQRGR